MKTNSSKNLSLALVLTSLLLFTGCSKNIDSTNTTNPPKPNSYSVDQSVYFKITFNGKTKTTYGSNYTDFNGLTTPDKSSCGASIMSFGNNYSILVIHVYGNSVDPQNLGQITFSGNCWKEGTPTIGTYYPDGSTGMFDLDRSNNIITFYSIGTDQSTPSKNSTVTVTSIDQNYITGTVSLQILDGNNLIPATGSFRLHN